MLTKYLIKLAIKTHFGDIPTIPTSGLFSLLSPVNQSFFGFYLQETISQLGYSISASFDIEIDNIHLTINFNTTIFRISIDYTHDELVDKILALSQRSAYIKAYKIDTLTHLSG